MATSPLKLLELDRPTDLDMEEIAGSLFAPERFTEKFVSRSEGQSVKPKPPNITELVISFRPPHSSSSRWQSPEDRPQHQTRVEEVEAPERQIERLQADRDKYAADNQLLQSRVSELQRTANREIQRYDQLLADYSKLQEQRANLQKRNENLIDALIERAKANDRLQSILISRADNRLRMTESYEGIVDDLRGDKVVVMYDVNGDIVEQIYERDQFIDGRLPDIGTRLAVFVNVAEVKLRSVESGIEEKRTHDEPADTGRKPLSGTIEF